LILFAIFSLLTRFVFRRRRGERDSTDEERESVLEWGDVLGSIGTRLRGLIRRRGDDDDALDPLRSDPRWANTVEIRETYQRLQRRGARAGRPRRAAETADEYRPGVVEAIPAPNVAPDIETITAAYDRARYSGVPASEEDAAAVKAAWADVERTPVPSRNEPAR
jgi:hypothetical protein